MSDKLKRSKIDKIGSGIVFVGTIVLFVVDKFSPFLITWGLNELKTIIPFVSTLSLFCFIWSFIWENKIQKSYDKIQELNNNIISQEENFVKEQKEFIEKNVTKKITEYNKLESRLQELVKGYLSKPDCTESRILKDYEVDLDKFLSLKNPNNEVVLVYVITNDADVENESFGNIICNNIISNCYYIYVTPFEDKIFKNKILDTLLKQIPDGITAECLKMIFSKRIIHFSNKELFKWLPEYSDFVIYAKKKRNKLDMKTDVIRGFYSFQNKAEIVDNVECYFYREMTPAHSQKLIECVESLDTSDKLKSIVQNSYSSSVKIENGGLYCTEAIKAGEVIMSVDGILRKKKDLEQNVIKDTKYLQFDSEYTFMTDIPINHSCKKPNCGINQNFNVVAIEDIAVKQEILIDYAFFDPEYERFECTSCPKGQCTRQSQSIEDIKKSIRTGPNKEYVSDYLKNKI